MFRSSSAASALRSRTALPAHANESKTSTRTADKGPRTDQAPSPDQAPRPDQAPSTKAQGPCLDAARDVKSAVHHEDFAGDRAGRRAEQEHRGVRHLRQLDVAPERRAIAIDLEDAREAGNAGGGER